MKFSVLIAHYNNSNYFKQCYESLKAQTVQDFEIILVDDCSTDNSLIDIQKLTHGDKRIKIFKNLQNKGVGYTKRKCVEYATGQICGFVDPDDALTSSAIEDMLNSHENKNIVAVYSQFYLCNELLEIQKIYPHSKKIRNNNPLFVNIDFEVAHFFSFKKEFYLKTEGINKDYKIAEDIDFYLKLYDVGRFLYLKKPLYLYRIHGLGLSHDNTKNEIKNHYWHQVIYNAFARRGIHTIYNKKINEIENLPLFIKKKNQPFLNKIFKKLISLSGKKG